MRRGVRWREAVKLAAVTSKRSDPRLLSWLSSTVETELAGVIPINIRPGTGRGPAPQQRQALQTSENRDVEEEEVIGFAADGSPNDWVIDAEVVRLVNEGSDLTPQEFFQEQGPSVVAYLEPLDASFHGFELEQTERCFSLGRHKSNSLQIPDSRISGLHCTVSCDTATGAYYLQDHSHNGSWLRRGDSKWLLKRTRVKLQAGDIFSVISAYRCPTHGEECGGEGGGACLQTPVSGWIGSCVSSFA